MVLEIIIAIIFIGTLVFLYLRMKEDQKSHEAMLNSLYENFGKSISYLSSSQEKLYMELAKFQDKHFKFSTNQTTKQLDLLNKQTKEFMGTVREGIRNKETMQDEITKFVNSPAPVIPTPTENEIEKTSEVPEYPLTDIDRVPITTGINVKFEGQEEILPINIEPVS